MTTEHRPYVLDEKNAFILVNICLFNSKLTFRVIQPIFIFSLCNLRKIHLLFKFNVDVMNKLQLIVSPNRRFSLDPCNFCHFDYVQFTL